ncbi:hypothetical protein [Poseidonocella sp. HB161398]|uniref:hypothetical protein n=1 Tax=Poseidonocella sp. HB161398 TaxID=2320855 RepID=UPI00110837FC|nr:hypothetical protein [Poseidonocella sp. HB161398]
MYTRSTESGGGRHLQLIEGRRDQAGKVRITVVANLGKLDPLINGLNCAAGRHENTASDVTCESSPGFGDVFAPQEIWKGLGFDLALNRALHQGRRQDGAYLLHQARPVPLEPRRQARAAGQCCRDQASRDRRAHALICFPALILYGIMHIWLKEKGHSASLRTAFDLLARIRKHTAHAGRCPLQGISRTTPEQLGLFEATEFPKPA